MAHNVQLIKNSQLLLVRYRFNFDFALSLKYLISPFIHKAFALVFLRFRWKKYFRSTLVLGFLPQELLGTSMYEYYHHDDIQALAECHEHALKTTDLVTTSIYRFRTKSGGFIKLQSEWKSFKNPWTKEIENLMAKNNLIM